MNFIKDNRFYQALKHSKGLKYFVLQYLFQALYKNAKMDTINFYKALRGEKLSSSIGDITFTTHYVGELIITSGRLVGSIPVFI